MIEQYVKDLDDILLESYIEEIYEGLSLEGFKDVFKKVGSELSTNFKFISTFGVVITLFFPLVDGFLKNMSLNLDLNPTNIVLATIGAISILIDNNKNKLKWVLGKLEDKQWEMVIHDMVKAFSNIKELFATIAKQLGKVIKSFADMLSYTFLFVPFLKLLLDFVQTHKINTNDLGGMALSVGTGVAIIAGKDILEWLTNELSKNKKLKISPVV